MNEQYFERYRRIQYSILKELPFYGKILLSLPFGITKCGTAYTDMKHIIFDPDFMDTLSDFEFKVLVLHELLHCILLHCTRSKGKVHELYNIACDIVVNSYIHEIWPIEEIAGYPFDHTYLGKEGKHYTADEIYEGLMKICDLSELPIDRHDVWEIVCKDTNNLEKDMDRKVKGSFDTTNTEGMSIGIRKLLEERYKPKIHWQDELHEFLSGEINKEDYSFSHRDTRFYNSSYVIPSLYDEEDYNVLNEIYIAVDVSASISDEEYKEYMDEINYLCEILHVRGYYSFFDTQITEPEEFNRENLIDFENKKGYGGTSFQIIFDLAQEYFKNKNLKAILIFTDGYAPIPNEIDIPVVWIINNEDVSPSYGKIIRMLKD